ncbi:MAG: CIA30 family protein [bacterium]
MANSSIILPVLVTILTAGGPALESTPMLIDDFSRSDGCSPAGACWTVFSDRVMGGLSEARAETGTEDGRRHLRLHGRVTLANNGGFIQTALDLGEGDAPLDARAFSGIRLEVKTADPGTGYALHLRTPDCILPWQHYKAEIPADAGWRTVIIPFAEFRAYRLGNPLDTRRLLRLGLVAGGGEFPADLRVRRIELVGKEGHE